MTNEEIIDGLKFTMEMCLYNPTDGSMRPVSTLNDMDKTTYDACEGAIQALEQTRWIPVSEPPKKSGEYLLYGNFNDGDDNTIFIGEYEADYEKFGWWQEYYDHNTLASIDREFIDYANVLAWRELPQPYKEESEDDECKGCYYNDGEVHAECVICDKAESEDEE